MPRPKFYGTARSGTGATSSAKHRRHGPQGGGRPPRYPQALAGAAVYVVNYLPILPEQGNGCWPQVPIARADVPYLRRKHKQLNRMLAQARTNGARVIDVYTAGIGHDACKLPLVRWVEPVAPASAAAPFHPNLQGMQATKRAVLARVAAR